MGIKGFLRNFFGLKKKTDRVLTSLDADDVENKALKEAYKKIQSLEAQLSDNSINEKVKDIEKKDFLDELKLVKELKNKSDKIDFKESKGVFELNRIEKYLKKYKNAKIDITDRDDNVIFDNFHSFIISGDKIGIKGVSGKIWCLGRSLNHIIYKPESIKNHLKRKRIPIPYDEELKFIPDLDKIMIGEIKYDSDEDEFRESEELIKPVKEMIMERERKISMLLEDKEYLENLNANQFKRIVQIERAFNVLKAQSKIENSDMSEALSSMLESSKRFGDLARRNTLLAQQKLSADDIVERYESMFDKLLEDMEDDGRKISVRKARDELHRDLQFAQKLEKRPIIINPEVQSMEGKK